jgi:penicillin-binding protein 1C
MIRSKRLMAIIAMAAIGWLGWHLYRAQVGEPTARLGDRWHEGQRILDRHGRVVRTLPSDLGQRGRAIPLEAMGDRLVVATLASEDRRFFDHAGVDGGAVLRAVAQNVRHARLVSGASTISQQLVKLLDHGGDLPEERRGLGEKVREAARAQNLETHLDKRAILEAYLNRLSYGRGVVGPAEAAETFFGVTPSELSWAQATLLAVLPRAPSAFDPYRHPERAVRRQRALIEELFELGFIDAADRERALAEPLDLEAIVRPFEAPHLTEALVAGHYGGISSGDTTVSIDLDLQHDVEGLIAAHRPRLAEGRARSAAVVVVDNASGEILAYVGGHWNDEAGQIDMARARRQPGSTLKPFVYAMAFERGLSPTEALADVPVRFGERAGGYAPENFDGRFLGPISAREALAGSLNVPAVRLAEEIGAPELLVRLRALGLESLDRDAEHYGLSLALGSGEVSLMELAEAHATLARGGEHLPLTVRPREAQARRVIEAEAAAAVTDALSDPLARVRGLGGKGPFDLGFPVAVKTGTSSGHRDSWTVGYTRERTVAVWVGNPDGRPTAELTGGAGAGPVFADVMRRAMTGVPRAPLYDASLLTTATVCPLSGRPATSACPEAVTRRIPASQGPAEACPFHRHAQVHGTDYQCGDTGPSVVLLPKVYDGWLATQSHGAPGRDAHGLPWLAASSVTGCTRAAMAILRVDAPATGAILTNQRGNASVELAATLEGARADIEVEFVLDGVVVARSGRPYRAFIPAKLGDHLLEVRPADPSASIALGRSHFSVR